MKFALALRLVALDSGLLANLSRDDFSRDIAARAKAMTFKKALTALGLVPLLTWHHLEELLRYKDLDVARARFRFLQSLPAVAWIAGYTDQGLPGSVVDILAYEVAAAVEHPELDASAIRDLVRPKLCVFGSGEQMLAMIDEGRWEYLRVAFEEQEKRSRAIVAISRATHFDVSQERVSTFLNGKLRSPEDTARMLAWLRRSLQDQIATRGDRRIDDPATIASDFMNEITSEGLDLLNGPPEQRIRFLEQYGVYASDIGPDTRMIEVNELGTFRSQLKTANKYLQHPWESLIKVVTPPRIPSWLIVNGLRRHGQDLEERKGSDLTDSYLAVLAAYADYSFVDKRTNENFIRVFRHETQVKALVRHVDKGGLYFGVPEKVQRWDRTLNVRTSGL